MSYLDILLPIDVDLQWTSAEEFSTDVLITDSGRESRNQNWDASLMRGVLRYQAKQQASWEIIDDMVQVCAGQAHSFRVRDPRRYIATTAQGKIVAGQMVYRRTVGSYTIDKIITKPDATVALTGGGTFSTATGLILTGSPTAWAGTFYLCCRFGADRLEVTGINKNLNSGLIAGFQDLPIIEVRDE